jgi:hypothetical protein
MNIVFEKDKFCETCEAGKQVEAIIIQRTSWHDDNNKTLNNAIYEFISSITHISIDD